MELGIVALADEKDSIALDTFLNRRRDLVALANKVVRNPAIAEELVQDSWLQWSSKTYPERDAAPIFTRIVMNLARDWHRKQKREWAKLEAFSLLHDDVPDTERIVISRMDLINVLRALQKLPAKSLRAFRLSRAEGMSFAEIGKQMGIAPSTAYGLVSEALIQVAVATQK